MGMSTPMEEAKRQSRWRRRVVVLAGVLFPLLVAGGVIVPQIITGVSEEGKQEQAELADSQPPALDFSNPYPGKTPLRLPRDYEAGFIPKLLDLQNLFSGKAHSGSQIEREYARLLGFPRSHGDVIVMDDVGRKIKDIIFKDPVMVGAVTASDVPIPSFAPFGGPGPVWRYPDPQIAQIEDSEPAVIPEPSTALLLLFGLVAIGYHRRA
jgi:hypothetical protein